MTVKVPGLVNEASCRWEEGVYVAILVLIDLRRAFQTVCGRSRTQSSSPGSIQVLVLEGQQISASHLLSRRNEAAVCSCPWR